MPGLEPGIWSSGLWGWIAGSSPPMTAEGSKRHLLLAWAFARVKAAEGVFRANLALQIFACVPASKWPAATGGFGAAAKGVKGGGAAVLDHKNPEIPIPGGRVMASTHSKTSIFIIIIHDNDRNRHWFRCPSAMKKTIKAFDLFIR